MEAQREQCRIEATDLRVVYPVRKGILGLKRSEVRAVDGVSFSLAPGKVLGIVGESGSGKTTLARAVLSLERISSGTLKLFGRDSRELSPRERKRTRLGIQAVFQDPFASLNPRLTVLELLTEGMVCHGLIKKRERHAEARRLLGEVGLPLDILDSYPHAFSGGQRQRLAIARALSLSPDVVVCDEAVSALDLSVQAQILNLLLDLRDKRGLSYLFITHDMGVVGHLADEIAVMRCGKFVETGDAVSLIKNPASEYTKRLLACAIGSGVNGF